MKYFSTLFILAALFTSGLSNAQQASSLNGKSYTFVMKDAVNGGDEVFDKLTFANNEVTSETYSQKGYTAGKMLEKNGGNTTNFQVTLTSPTEGTRFYSGKVTGNDIDGTIVTTDASGAKVTYAFRGMLTSEWNKMMEMKGAKQ